MNGFKALSLMRQEQESMPTETHFILPKNVFLVWNPD